MSLGNFLTQHEALKWLTNNTFLADVHFVFDNNDILYAHSLILATRSNVFHTQIQLCETNIKEFHIQESNIEQYKEFLEFIYTDDCEVTENNYEYLMKLARNHSLTALVDKCMQFSESFNINNLNCENEIKAPKCSLLEDEDTIAERFSDIIKSDEFLNFDNETVYNLIKLDIVDETNESKIIDAVMEWAEYKCGKNNLTVTGLNKRNILGVIFNELRFQSMNVIDFAQCITKYSDMFTINEIADLLISIAKNKNNNSGFSAKQRKSIYNASATEYTLIIRKDHPGELIRLPETKSIFKVSHRILLLSCWVWAHAQDLISCKLRTGNIILYEGRKNASLKSPHLVAFNFVEKIILKPDCEYTLEFGYEKLESSFWCRIDPTANSFTETEGIVSFEFLEYGMNMLRRITFKK